MVGQLAPDLLDLRGLFAAPWGGSGILWLPWWLRWVPKPRTFTFRSEILGSAGESWDVLDTMTYPDGSTWIRRMHCQVLPHGRMKLSAEDMPGGAEITPRHDGFDFSPYVIEAPILGPLRARLRCCDVVRIEDGRMTDRIELRFLGVRVGLMTMHLSQAA